MTDGEDALSADVCYRHSGGNERSATVDRGVKGPKGKKGRANAVFLADLKIARVYGRED